MVKKIISIETVNMLLRQQGAKTVKVVPAKMTTVEFEINECTKITYMYEMTDKGDVYLQRVKPYPMNMGVLSADDELVNNIAFDIQNFSRACQSDNYLKYLELANQIGDIERELEDMFLMNDIKAEQMDEIHNAMNDLHEEINRIYKK